MDLFMVGLGTLVNVFFIAVIVAGVMKLFQIHAVLGEIKEELSKGRSFPPVAAPPAPAFQAYTAPQPYSAPVAPSAPVVGDGRSGEEMLRELDAQMMLEEARRRGGLNPR
jgi:hypothetical protein